ncbi:TIR domain-containing adapter molecule 1 [Echeneis naucrates]|uniref:TIR domain-containing adapter molecule 1-like n=1 Tax=Echeneis naucrates TaxID=173247 RepID=A0A665T539_ECHNA|nr:TIR domain-containing adapter molecule 1-like [Echeneis naucrates]
MSHEGQENQGTGLSDIFDILVKEPPERLLSLTIQLGESPEDDIIHAMCLIILRREAQALEKLHMVKDNCLANHLAELWKTSGGKLEDFRSHCSDFQAFTVQSLAVLARIFKVLSEKRLCDSILRNLAYQRAISPDSKNTSNCEELEYDQLREEAKDVCGPQVEEWLCSPKGLKSGSYHDLQTTLKMTDPLSGGLHGSLQESPSVPSYPTHLEMSIPPTMPFLEDKITSDKPNISALPEPGQTQPKSNEYAHIEAKEHSVIGAAFEGPCKNINNHIIQNKTQPQTTEPSTEPKYSMSTTTSISEPKAPASSETYKSKCTEADDEVTFYAFVILHAQEDADLAESLKERIEKVASCTGATFSEDFAIPGKSTLRCVEDAINNSAFTLLLFTRNFNTTLLEMKTDTALVNSINKEYKHNTVVPLLPCENRMPKQDIPMVVQRLNALDENRNFESKIRKFLSAAQIEKQKRFWTAEQRVRREKERQGDLKHLNHCQKRLNQELHNVHLGPQKDAADDRARWQNQGSIHINNANYVMIGNSSKMNVAHGGYTDSHSSEDS